VEVTRTGRARSATVLDLTKVPDVPSIFDLDRSSKRDAIIFLQEFAKEMSKPIDQDDRLHVEYVPTQVVTEYIRVSPTLQAMGVEGVRFDSSRRKSGISLVLFGGRDLLCLSESEREALTAQEKRAAGKRAPLLRLTGAFPRVFPPPGREHLPGQDE
jgi:RES domain